MPFRPKHIRQFSEAELEALERLNLNSADSPMSPLRYSTTVEHPPTPSKLNMSTTDAGSVSANKIDIGLLEKKAELNGHAEQA